MTKKPIYKIQHGRVSAAVWENDGKDGTFETISLERTYQDGEELKNSTSFSARDIPNIERCLFDLKVREATAQRQ